jgi:hypothetical protein
MIKKVGLVAGFVLVLLILMAIISGLLNKNKTTISVKVVPTVTIDPSLRKYENEYVSFVYPAKYEMEMVPPRDGRVYASVKFVDKSGTIIDFTLLFRESSQELNELEDVKMRRGSTYQYSEEVARKDTGRGLLFRTADRKERVAYMTQKGRLLVLTMITKGAYSDEIEKEFQDLLSSVVWK